MQLEADPDGSPGHKRLPQPRPISSGAAAAADILQGLRTSAACQVALLSEQGCPEAPGSPRQAGTLSAAPRRAVAPSDDLSRQSDKCAAAPIRAVGQTDALNRQARGNSAGPSRAVASSGVLSRQSERSAAAPSGAFGQSDALLRHRGRSSTAPSKAVGLPAALNSDMALGNGLTASSDATSHHWSQRPQTRRQQQVLLPNGGQPSGVTTLSVMTAAIGFKPMS